MINVENRLSWITDVSRNASVLNSNAKKSVAAKRLETEPRQSVKSVDSRQIHVAEQLNSSNDVKLNRTEMSVLNAGRNHVARIVRLI